MRVLLGGANGFIGKALSTALIGEGIEVFPIVRTTPSAGQAHLDVASRTLDVSQLPGAGLDDIDAVINLAGEAITPMRWSARKKEAIRSSRVATTDVLARAIAKATRPPTTFLCGSAIGYYGSRGDEDLDEQSELGTGFLAEVCEAWEFAASPAEKAGARVVHLRTSIVLGSGGGALKPQLPLFRVGLGGRLGSGKQWTSWISLTDEVAAIVHLLKTTSVTGAVNLASPNPVTNATFTDAFAAVVHKPAPFVVPATALRLWAGHQVAEDVMLASQRVYPRALQASGFRFTHPALIDALRIAIGTGGDAEPPDQAESVE